MSVLAAYVRPSSNSEIVKVNNIPPYLHPYGIKKCSALLLRMLIVVLFDFSDKFTDIK